MKQEILEKAAQWYDRRGELSASEHNEFLRWLEEEEHRLAYEKVASCIDSPTVLEALKYGEKKATAKLARPIDRVFFHKSHMAIAASMAMFSIIFLFAVNTLHVNEKQPEPVQLSEANSPYITENYKTDKAIRAIRVLSDGSRVHLNALSSIAFDQSEQHRRVTLEQGQVLFDVSHDAQRPFVIDIGKNQVEVLGTVFDIDRSANRMSLHVYEGLVKVSADRSIQLRKGQSVDVVDNIVGDIQEHRDLTPSWRSGWLEINQEPLAVVVTKFQRYIEQPLILDRGISPEYRISGRFNLDQPIESLQLLSHISDLELDIDRERIRIAKRF